MICKCGSKIPDARTAMGYKTCVNCSTESKWSAVPLVFHKTGNTTQIIKDPELAAELIYMSSRKGFGVMRGMTSKRNSVRASEPRKKKEIVEIGKTFSKVVDRKMPTYYFEKVGQTAVEILEKQNLETAIMYVEKALAENLIYKKQSEQLKAILSQISL